MKWVIAIVCVFLIGCGTSYKSAPTTARIDKKVATAKRSNEESSRKAVKIETSTVEARAKVNITGTHIDAAIDAMNRRDYVTAAQELVLGRASNSLVQFMLEQSLVDIQSLKASLAQTGQDLVEAQQETAKVENDIVKLAAQQAKDHAIVEEVNWGFRVGALLYFVKGVLAMGFWGALILGGILIALLLIGGPCAIFAGKIISWLINLVRKR